MLAEMRLASFARYLHCEPVRLLKDDQQITPYAFKYPEARAHGGECHINLAIPIASGLTQD